MKDGLSKLYAAVPLLEASGAFAQFVPAPTDLTTKEGYAAFDLENVLIGNFWSDPLVQYHNFSVFAGNTYGYDPYNASVKAEWNNNLYGEGNCLNQTKHCYATGQNSIYACADDFCANKVENLYDIYSGRDEYDMRYLTPDPSPVQKAIDALQNFSESSSIVSSAFDNTGDDDRESGTIEACKKLLAAGVQVVLYYGDADYNCNWLGGQVVADEIAAPSYDIVGFVNTSTSDNIVHGQVKQSGLFSFLRIYESGHEVSCHQLLASLEIFERALKRVDIATGECKVGAGYKTVGTPTGAYRKGNATIQFEVTPKNATYNTALNAPDPEPTWTVEAVAKNKVKRSKGKLGQPRMSLSKRRSA